MAGETERCKPLIGLLSGLAQDIFHGTAGVTEELLRTQLYPEVSPEEFRPFLAKMRGILKTVINGLPPPQLYQDIIGKPMYLCFSNGGSHLMILRFLDHTLRCSWVYARELLQKSYGVPEIKCMPAPYAHSTIATALKENSLNNLKHELFSVATKLCSFAVFQSIASADMDFNQLEAFLTAQTKKQGGITSEQAALISKFWRNQKGRIRESLMNQSRWDNRLRGLSWRVDNKSQSRHSAQIHTPVAIMELELGKSGQKSEFLYLEMDEVKVNQVLKKLSELEESINTLMQTA